MPFPQKHIWLVGCLLISTLMGNRLQAQSASSLDTIRVHAIISPSGDTIPYGVLPAVFVYTKLTAQQRKYWAEWTRLRNAVYVTYPYAMAASRIMNEINVKLEHVTNKKERRQIIHSREKELKKEFTDKLTQLSVYQGKVLMKLINRETGNNCYEIIKEFKGGFNAGFWQAVAFVFGSNLKQPYEAKGEDREIEKLVQEVCKVYGYKG